jgi:hypothetical protein
MLRTETQVFGEVLPSYGPKGEPVSKGRKGLSITSTQMPCSAQREVAARFLSMLPQGLPQELREGRALGETDGLALAYTLIRSVLSNADGVKYLSDTFGRHARIEVSPGVFEGLSPETIDDQRGLISPSISNGSHGPSCSTSPMF